MTMKVKTGFTALGVIVLLAFLAAPVSATPPDHANDPVDLSFVKVLISEGHWEGEVSGDLPGGPHPLSVDLTLGPRVTGSIWHVSFQWIVDAGANSFEADVWGIINTKTGRVVLNGVVTDGWLMGAQLHIEAQLDSIMGSEGTIRIMPSS